MKKLIVFAFVMFVCTIVSFGQSKTIKQKSLDETALFLKSISRYKVLPDYPEARLSQNLKGAKYKSVEIIEDSKNKQRVFILRFNNLTQRQEFVSIMRIDPGHVTHNASGGPGNGPYTGCEGGGDGCGIETAPDGWTYYYYY